MEDKLESIIQPLYCPICLEKVIATPIGYLCKVHKDLTILQVISERVAELRRKKRDEREQEV